MEKTFKFLLGIVKVSIIIEDRLTDDISRRYKHQVLVDIFNKRVFSHIVRSSTLGMTFVDNKEISHFETHN